MPRCICRIVFFLAGFLVAGPGGIFGQSLTGRISGTLTDSTGAVVAGATVSITQIETQAVRTAVTDSQGFYSVENLRIGTYKVGVNQPGFKRSEKTGLELVGDGRITADLRLEIGDLSQSVSVTAAAEQLNAVSGEVAHVIDQRQVDNLPLNGRNYMELLTLVPGVAVTNPDQFSVTTSLSATNQVVNGHRSNQNNITVDGLGNLDAGANGSLINNVSPDFMQEVKIQTSNFSAEYGRSAGAAFNMATKNGTNTFHGSAFEYFRNDALDARNYFSPANTELRFNNFGYSVGGPIQKNKLFFFVGEEWKRLRQQTSAVRETVPTTAELAGNFAGTGLTIYQPGTKTPYPNNAVPASAITTDGLAIGNVYKQAYSQAAVFTNTPTKNNATYETPSPMNYREDIARVDYKINEKHSLFGRWIQDENNIFLAFGPSSTTGSYVPVVPEIRSRPAQSPILYETWVISPHLVNEAHFGASWNGQRYLNQGDDWTRTAAGFTFQRVYNSFGPWINGVPDVSINGYAGFQGPDHALTSPTAEIEGGDTLSIVHGQHTIRTGVLIIRNRKNQNGRALYDGAATFNSSGNPNTTGSPVADALLSNFSSYQEAAYDPIGYYRYTEPAGFVDDTWKVSRRLSLNLGLRYEYYMTMYSAINNLSNFVPSLYNPANAVTLTSKGQIVAGSGNIHNGLQRVANGINSTYDYLVPNAADPAVLGVPSGGPRGMYPSHGEWAPRVGLSYAVNDKTVIRGGFGLFYDRIQGNPTFYTLANPPYVSSVSYVNGNLSDITGSGPVHLPFGAIQTIQPNLATPYSEQFSLSIQRTLPFSLFLETDYVGTLGRHLLVEPDINQPSYAVLGSVASTTNENTLRPYAGFSTIQQFMSAATSNYHALEVQLSRRAGSVLFTGAYSFSKVLGNSSSDTENDYDAFNLYRMYGPLSFDASHVFSGSMVWSLPKFKNLPSYARWPLGNWQVSGVVHLQTGFPLYITGTTPILGSPPADYVGGPALAASPGANGWVNPAAFTSAPQSRFGTVGAGNVRGPGLQTYDIGVARSFPLWREGTLVQFRTEFINAFNNVNFQAPDTKVTDAAFGTVSSAYPSRNIQLSLKLVF